MCVYVAVTDYNEYLALNTKYIIMIHYNM
jgi:hypothetical protein